MNIEEYMGDPNGEVGVDMDENKKWNKTLDMLEKVGEDKTLFHMD